MRVETNGTILEGITGRWVMSSPHMGGTVFYDNPRLENLVRKRITFFNSKLVYVAVVE